MATNILSSQLLQMENDGLISKQIDLKDKRKKIYRLEQPGKDMLPIILEMMIWSDEYDPNTNAPKDFIDKIKTNKQEVIESILAS